MHGHMLKYHLLLPAAIVVVLAAFGVPLWTAVGYGMAAGCMSMMLMGMRGGGHAHHDRGQHDHDARPTHDGRAHDSTGS